MPGNVFVQKCFIITLTKTFKLKSVNSFFYECTGFTQDIIGQSVDNIIDWDLCNKNSRPRGTPSFVKPFSKIYEDRRELENSVFIYIKNNHGSSYSSFPVLFLFGDKYNTIRTISFLGMIVSGKQHLLWEFISHLPFTIYAHDLTGSIKYFSNTITYFGYKNRRQYLNQKIQNVLVDKSKALVNNILINTVNDIDNGSTISKILPYDLYVKNRKKSEGIQNKSIPIEVIPFVMNFEEDYLVIGLARRIREEKAVQSQVYESSLNFSTTPIYRYQKDHSNNVYRFTYVNKAFASFLGYTREEIVPIRGEYGMPVLNIFPVRNQIEIQNKIDDRWNLRTNVEASYDTVIITKNGKELDCTVNACPFIFHSREPRFIQGSLTNRDGELRLKLKIELSSLLNVLIAKEHSMNDILLKLLETINKYLSSTFSLLFTKAADSVTGDDSKYILKAAAFSDGSPFSLVNINMNISLNKKYNNIYDNNKYFMINDSSLSFIFNNTYKNNYEHNSYSFCIFTMKYSESNDYDIVISCCFNKERQIADYVLEELSSLVCSTPSILSMAIMRFEKRINNIIKQSRNIEENISKLLSTILRLVVNEFKCLGGGILIKDEDRLINVCSYNIKWQDNYKKFISLTDKSILHMIVESGKPFVHRNITKDDNYGNLCQLNNYPLSTFIGIPIIDTSNKSLPIGVLFLVNKKYAFERSYVGSFFSKLEKDILVDLVSLLSLCVEIYLTLLQNSETLRMAIHEMTNPAQHIWRMISDLLLNQKELNRRDFIQSFLDMGELIRCAAEQILGFTGNLGIIKTEEVEAPDMVYPYKDIIIPSLKACEFSAETNGIHLDWSEKGNVKLPNKESVPSLFLSKNQMKQVFLNLINNAIKYKENNNAFKIYISYLADSKSHIFYVADDGCGIEKDKVKYIFERGYRYVPKQSFGTPGLGFGLWFAKRIVRLHGGEIKVSKIKGPTTFEIRLPKELETETTARQMLKENKDGSDSRR